MMKTQNTREDKARFMALYWGQKVVKRKDVPNLGRNTTNEYLQLGHENWVLELSPLSQISDYDARKSLDIFRQVDNNISPDNLADPTLAEFTEQIYELVVITPIDHYLRSKGYALPWLDLSVEDLIEYGWVKLKEA